MLKELQKILNNDSYLKYYDINIDLIENSIIVEGIVSLYHHKQILNHLLIDFMKENHLKFEIQNNVEVKSSFTD